MSDKPLSERDDSPSAVARLWRRLDAIRAQRGLSMRGLALAAGLKEDTLRDIKRGRMPRGDRLEALAAHLGMTVGQLLAEGDAAPAPRPAAPEPSGASPIAHAAPFGARDLPVYGTAAGGDGEMILSYDPIEYIDRPARLVGVRGAFAMYVVGDSMAPRFEPGELLLIHPTRPLRRGHDVLVVRTGGGSDHVAMVKRFVRWTADALELEQLNPPKRLRLPKREVKGVHLVVGHQPDP